ncbi:alpha amylase C-terminal domain-containing protein [Polyangium aurulentum]|uniref:alpha amylase C-terminal domain-containing protein n=1 Tax=Polyangium aurulentum TaxID=2567896 RepID=UPI0010AE41AD|nr:alpha amylase C-terminal domain-containing protein [Polyangium aurulentum]UQA60959.1 alpha amylase C-terminal domain-containing protein [Polyangium aurulentum]
MDPSPTPASQHSWMDADYMRVLGTRTPRNEPISIYEVHLGSFRRVPEEADRPLTYRELARWLPEHAGRLGFTHVEILPDPGIRAPFVATSYHGSEEDLMALVDALHGRGLGVIWGNVALDPRGDDELERAVSRLEAFHADGVRVVFPGSASEGAEREEAEALLRQFNERLHARLPGAFTVAAGAPDPAAARALGFDFVWDLGFESDLLAYLGEDPFFRQWRHDLITSRRMTTVGQPVVLALSHQAALGGKPSLLARMHGDRWQKFANLRLLYALAFMLPGKKLFFMGNEIAQERGFAADRSLDWHLVESESEHLRMQHLVGELNAIYRAQRSLHELDLSPEGFSWLDTSDAERSVIAFERKGDGGRDASVVVFNFTPVPRANHRIGVPSAGHWEEALNTDAVHFGGSGQGNFGGVEAAPVPAHGKPFSLNLTLPPLGAIVLRPQNAAR